MNCKGRSGRWTEGTRPSKTRNRSRITSKMEDAYVLVQSKVYLCYTCDDRPYKIKQSDERSPQRLMRSFTGPSYDSRYSISESSADPRLNGKTGLPVGRGDLR
jgi:hypothetical protein